MKEESGDFELCSSDDAEDARNLESQKTSAMKTRYRSPSFSIRETNFLMHCIMAEKQYINNGKNDSITRRDRDEAWERVARVYNKKFCNSPRSIKMLRNKYLNYKKKVRRESSDKRRSGSKINHLNFNEDQDNVIYNVNNSPQSVKIERDLDISNHSGAVTYDEAPTDFEILFTEKGLAEKRETSSDPLSAVLNGFTNTDSQSGSSYKEDPDVVRLKIELLNYQLETAKMERERVKAAIEAESADRKKKHELLNLQIREAQMNISVAERRLSEPYPAANENSHYHEP